MSGPNKEANSALKKNNTKGLSNQILNYLLGFSSKIEPEEEHHSSEQQEQEVMKPKVNSRDAKLHFLMGRYNSH